MDSFWIVWDTLGPKAHKRFLLILVLTFLSGFVELLGVGLVIPFIAVAANSAWAQSNRYTHQMTEQLSSLGVPESQHTLALGLLFLAGVGFANLFQCGFQYFTIATIQSERRSLCVRLVKQFSRRPLEWLDKQNSVELTKALLIDVDQTMEWIQASIQVAAVMTRCLLVYLLFLVSQASLAITAALAITTSYLLVFRYLYRPVVEAGNKAWACNNVMSRAASELLGGLRDMRASQSEPYFIERFERAADSAVVPHIIRGMPSYLTRGGLETLTVALVVAMLVYLKFLDGNLDKGLPLLSGYAVAGIRLLPGLQTALTQVFKIKFNMANIHQVARLLKDVDLADTTSEVVPIEFSDSIRLKNICYSYGPEAEILKSISLTIPKNSRVALVGETGAGKSTLMDILLGLRQPQQGTMQIDQLIVNRQNAKSWTARIGYVAQSIYFLDASIAENVALGHSPENIDKKRLEEACRQAHIHEFIQGLPDGYQTVVGERGIRLSGGQCQRVGIARALYQEVDVILFDEATSALDTAVENQIVKEIEQLQGDKTMIFTAHRLSTVWDFDIIFVLADGRLVGQGRAEELLQSCPTFAKLAEHQVVGQLATGTAS